MSQKRTLGCLLFVLVFGANAVVFAQDESGDIYARINSLRASVGVAAYTFNGALAAAAQQQAQWIVETGDVSHTHPDGSGPRTRALANGYPSNDVSENIYGGTMANVDIAWNFWLNSPIHYHGLVDQRYRDVGVGIAHGAWGAAYVIVFGNPGGPPPAPPSSGGGASGGGEGDGQAVAALPSYIVGQDEHGNIMHEVQPGDTLGDIALIYGYTWDDLPALMALNGLADVRDLEPGTIFLVPPHEGTWTPEPGDQPPPITPTEAAAASATPLPTIEPPVTLIPLPTAPHVATAIEAPAELIATVVAEKTVEVQPIIAALPTNAQGSPVPPGEVTVVQSGPSPWLGIAFGAQVILLGAAFVEFFRRSRRRR